LTIPRSPGGRGFRLSRPGFLVHGRPHPGGLGPVRRTLPAAGQAALAAGQVPGLACQVPDASDLLPIAGHREILNAKVHTDRAAAGGQRLRVLGVNGEGHVPAAVRLAGYDHHRRVQGGQVHVRPRPHEPQRTGRLREPQHAVAQGERAASAVRGLAGAAGLEPGAAGAMFVERGERLMLVARCLLQRYAGCLVGERQLRVFLHRGQRPVGCRAGSGPALGVPGGLAGGQRPVPHHANAAERAAQHCLLLRAGTCLTPVRRPHSHRIAYFFARGAEARRARPHLIMLPRLTACWIPPGPGGPGILRRPW
jgi:hypothetical protein